MSSKICFECILEHNSNSFSLEEANPIIYIFIKLALNFSFKLFDITIHSLLLVNLYFISAVFLSQIILATSNHAILHCTKYEVFHEGFLQ